MTLVTLVLAAWLVRPAYSHDDKSDQVKCRLVKKATKYGSDAVTGKVKLTYAKPHIPGDDRMVTFEIKAHSAKHKTVGHISTGPHPLYSDEKPSRKVAFTVTPIDGNADHVHLRHCHSVAN